ncbi:hypothetical protein FBEOM_11684 [Fusarium beomiforme]|uniref:Uncharacterized protein n=1 Tax=Fusarium beomiforme TaxID=44412 RepID=A0A9P5DTR7_9HYPO|nr:hypothetical protein FBEOM_11684 [Fusarium beomiforme]
MNDHTTSDLILTPLERWRVVECMKELDSALRALADVFANPCRITARNPLGNAPLLQNNEYHSPVAVKENLRRLAPSYTRQCVEADTFAMLLERFDLAASTPLDHETARKKGKWPKELPASFVSLINRCISDGNPIPRIVVRYAGQGPVRRGAAQATPQKHRANAAEEEGEGEGGDKGKGEEEVEVGSDKGGEEESERGSEGEAAEESEEEGEEEVNPSSSPIPAPPEPTAPRRGRSRGGRGGGSRGGGDRIGLRRSGRNK